MTRPATAPAGRRYPHLLEGNQRPSLVTIVGWYFILLSALGIYRTIQYAWSSIAILHLVIVNEPPIWMQATFGVLACFVDAGFGVAMLRGKNAARYFFLVWKALNITASWALDLGVFLGPLGAAVMALPAMLLFLKSANVYFRGGPSPAHVFE